MGNDKTPPESEVSPSDDAKVAVPRRPSGLAEGDFVVPDDFDDLLPDEIQRLFHGHEETMC